ncbi:MAG: hypothetical protein J0G30_08600 [Actinomycetales bacterium]|nr:hypothetical protein [Actinomycetales bacterium]
MPGTEELYPPFLLDWWWWGALPLFAALLIAWILLSKRVARARGFLDDPGLVAGIPWQPQVDPVAQALQRIRVVEQALGAGQLTVRDAHHELSTILRDFAYLRTGIDARTMTLDELRASSLGRIADLIEDFYPVAFAPDPSHAVDDALVNVRATVRAWS